MAVEATRQKRLKKQSDALYERYNKPLEAERSGEYVAIAPNGRLVLGHNIWRSSRRRCASWEPGADIFRVDTKAVGKWR